jgi:holdfast attachment protein HfaA
MNIAAIAALAATLLGSTVAVAGYSDMGSYNHPYGMGTGQETQTIAPSLRDANGNLTMVNGQVTSANFGQQTGVQQASATTSGTGSGGSGAMYGGATAIGNSLNVVTNGSFNTVIVDSIQTNKGNQTANVSLTGK